MSPGILPVSSALSSSSIQISSLLSAVLLDWSRRSGWSLEWKSIWKIGTLEWTGLIDLSKSSVNSLETRSVGLPGSTESSLSVDSALLNDSPVFLDLLSTSVLWLTWSWGSSAKFHVSSINSLEAVHSLLPVP